MTPKSFFWLIEERRVLVGLEHMAIQGWPKSLLVNMIRTHNWVTDSLLRDLAGNSYCGPVVMALIMALLMSLPFMLGSLEPCVQSDDESSDDIDAFL